MWCFLWIFVILTIAAWMSALMNVGDRSIGYRRMAIFLTVVTLIFIGIARGLG